ncbi:MAG: CoA-binding protein [Gemmatimonadota bacterium]
MSEIARLSILLEQSGDPRNPSAPELRALLATTRSVAVVGLSRDTRKPARRVPSYLATKGLEVIPVNPFADRLLGRKAHPHLSSVTQPVDMVLVFRPSAEAGQVLLDTISRPERPAVWLPEGVLAHKAAGAARSRGLTVVQDLCIYLAFRELDDFVPRPAVPLREALPPPPHDPSV